MENRKCLGWIAARPPAAFRGQLFLGNNKKPIIVLLLGVSGSTLGSSWELKKRRIILSLTCQSAKVDRFCPAQLRRCYFSPRELFSGH